MKKCENNKYRYEFLDGCQKEVIEGCDSCHDYKEEDVATYATKYKECKICGTYADCTYTSQEDGLCQSCRIREEYYEREGKE